MIRHINIARGPYGSGMRKLPAFSGKVIMLTLTGLMALLLWENNSARAVEAAEREEPPSPTLGEDVTPMDKSFLGKPRRQGYLPAFKEQLKDASPFFRDTKLELNLRTYNASSDNFDETKKRGMDPGRFSLVPIRLVSRSHRHGRDTLHITAALCA